MVYKLPKVFINDTCHYCAPKISPLHTKTQDYHLKYPNMLLYFHNVDIFSLKKLLMLMHIIIILIFSMCDTLRPLRI